MFFYPMVLSVVDTGMPSWFSLGIVYLIYISAVQFQLDPLRVGPSFLYL